MKFHFYHHRQSFNLDMQAEIPDHGVMGIYGPSGAGKSTLLAMMAGLVTPDAGQFTLEGACLFDCVKGINIPAHQRHIGMMFQDNRLFPQLTVQDNLNYGFKLLAKEKRRLGFNQVVELLEIGQLLKQKPLQLSGGEKQRVALGRALLASPRLLLLDEPLASLDVRLKRQILPFLRRIKDETQTPMVYVSHAIDEILYLTPKIAMLEAGKILAVGDFNQVIHDERVLALAQSLGVENVLHTRILAHHATLGYTIATVGKQRIVMPTIDAPLGSMVSVSIAAANIALSTHLIEGISIQNQLAGTVSSIQVVGSRTLVSVDVGVELMVEVTNKALVDLKIALGMQVYCLTKAQSIQPISMHEKSSEQKTLP